jgi:phosphoribosylglycinamide formyltransferase-1
MNRANHKPRIGFLLSGGGTTFENLMENIRDGKVDAEVAVVISSRKDAFGLKRAEKWGVPTRTVESRKFKNDSQAFSAEIARNLDEYKVDWVIMGGFMCFFVIPAQYQHKVVNVHPALLPAFGGKGMYGEKVHDAVLAYGAKFTGCTVHFVDNDAYDHGPIIMQKVVPVTDDDTEETLAAKVQAAEREIYPAAIQLLVTGRLKLENRHVRIIK